MRQILWPGVLGALDYDVQLQVTAAAGFDGLTISPLTVRQLRDRGVSLASIRDMAAARGITLTHLDGMTSWAPVWLPPEDSPMYARYHARFSFSADECLDMCGALGLGRLVAVPIFGHGTLPQDEVAGAFAAFCARAAAQGVTVELEFMPYAGLQTPAEAATILRAAGAPNSGLVVDTWHLCRASRDLDADLALIEGLPPGMCTALQLADARSAARPADPFADLVANGRELPGEGALPIARIAAAVLRNNPALDSIGPEPSSADYLDLAADVLGRRSGETTRAALTAARALLA